MVSPYFFSSRSKFIKLIFIILWHWNGDFLFYSGDSVNRRTRDHWYKKRLSCFASIVTEPDWIWPKTGKTQQVPLGMSLPSLIIIISLEYIIPMHTNFIKNQYLLHYIHLSSKIIVLKATNMPFSGLIRSDSERCNMQKEPVDYVFCNF